MPLNFLVAEARKNTPGLGKTAPVELTKKPSVERVELKKTMAEISTAEKVVSEKETIVPSWRQCQYLKVAGDRHLCKQYMSWCAEEKCQQKFMETGFFDFKKHLKHGKTIK